MKIGDLNVSKIMREKLSYTQTGTPFYASPEVWRDKPYDFKSDVWSLGVIIYELCSLAVPFKAENIDDLYKKVCRGTYKPIPDHFSPKIGSLIKAMLQLDPEKRPSCAQILLMPIVKDKMKQLGHAMEDLESPSKFKPSTVQHILTPYNPTLIP